jgi:site-specific DNA-cytosine methylase
MGTDDIGPTMCAKYGTGGNNMPCVVDASIGGGTDEIGPGNLPVLHNCQLWDAPENDMAPCLRARMGTGDNSGPMIPEDDMGHYVVRRITPKECERLQGFPDGHTDIGEWTDKKDKKRQTTDAARYKALGNSMAVPCMRWIAQRIDWALAHPITEDTSEPLDWQPDLFG